MTGDGVNDALALKDADIGIAMGSGAPATRAVAQIVLLDGKFATMPGVVAEGRRVIANIERVANLFVTKTCYATLLALAIAIARWPYPFLPRHMTIVSSLTIGIPAFFLALAPNPRRYVPGFVPTGAALCDTGRCRCRNRCHGVVRDRAERRGREYRRGTDVRNGHTAHCRSVGAEPAGASDHEVARAALLFDGRRVRDHPGRAGPTRLLRPRPSGRHGNRMRAFVVAGIAGLVLEVGWRVRGPRPDALDVPAQEAAATRLT